MAVVPARLCVARFWAPTDRAASACHTPVTEATELQKTARVGSWKQAAVVAGVHCHMQGEGDSVGKEERFPRGVGGRKQSLSARRLYRLAC